MHSKALVFLLLMGFSAVSGCSLVYRSEVRPFVVGPGGGPPGASLPRSPFSPLSALIYSSHKAPLSTDFKSTPADCPKVGKASTFYVFIPLFFVNIDLALEDASVKKAAQKGGISKVHYADYEHTSILIFFGSYETIVYGE